MTLLTQTDFAKQQGWQKSYITQLKAAGRLVMVDGLVDVESSLALIARTADPSRDQVSARHAAKRAAGAKTAGGVGAESGAGEKNAPGAAFAAGGAGAGQGAGQAGGQLDGDKVAASYSKSRAMKEFYAAQTAKAMYEKDVLGKLCDTEEVARAGAGLGAVLRTKLEGLSDRLAPVLAPVGSVEETHALLVENFEAVLNEIANELEKLSRTVTKGAA